MTAIRLSAFGAIVAVLGIGVVLSSDAPAQLPPYAGAFTDREFYPLAIAADLRRGRTLAGEAPVADLDTALAIALRMHQRGIERRGAGWLFQPGRMSTHPDFAYAGRAEKQVGMDTALVADIAYDASHFTRWPLFLRSHEESWPAASGERGYYADLERGLEAQFFDHVLVPPTPDFDGYRTRNYMDGRNGVYRWGYQSHRGDGYGPYELSGTLFYGWWAFLGTTRSEQVFAGMARRFPYRPEVVRGYYGPRRSMPQFTDGRFELSIRLAAMIRPAEHGCDLVPGARAKLDTLWRQAATPLLRDSIWAGGRAESEQYTLMVPTHAAFWCGVPAWREELAAHFARSSEADWEKSAPVLLQRMMYLYLASRFVVLARESGNAELIPPALPEKLLAEWRSWWNDGPRPISNTGWGEPRFRGFERYMRWKLDQLPRGVTNG